MFRYAKKHCVSQYMQNHDVFLHEHTPTHDPIKTNTCFNQGSKGYKGFNSIDCAEVHPHEREPRYKNKCTKLLLGNYGTMPVKMAR